MSETKTAIGTLGGIMEKSGDWHEIHVELPGKQYPLKISTKIQELVEMARAAGSNVMEWTYTEQDSGNPNPHRPGQNYINRYFESVAPVGENSQNGPNANAVEAGSADGMTPEKWDAKERRDLRSRAWAQTISAATHTISVEDMKDADAIGKTFTRLQVLQRKIYEDVAQSFAYPADQEDVPF